MSAFIVGLPAEQEDHLASAEEITQAYVGRYMTLLSGGDSYLLKVTEAHRSWKYRDQIILGCEREIPQEEPIPEPLELSGSPVNEVEDGITYPCQPIGCDHGYHLPGCVFDG